MTNKLKQWSTTAASNNLTVPEGFPEGMAPSNVNNSARAIMGRLREWYQGAEWIDLGHTINSATAQTIVLAGDVSAFYTVNRAVRADGVVGYVVSCTVSTNTTVVVSSTITFSGVPTIFEVGIMQTALFRAPGNFAVGTALSLGTQPTFSLTGDVTAPAVAFDGHTNIALATTLVASSRVAYAFGTFGSTGSVVGAYNMIDAVNIATGRYQIKHDSGGNWPANAVFVASPLAAAGVDMRACVETLGGNTYGVALRNSAGTLTNCSFYAVVYSAS